MQETQGMWVQSLGWKDPLEKEMATTLVFLPGKSHGLKSQGAMVHEGRKELDTTKHKHSLQDVKLSSQFFFLFIYVC